MTPYRSKKHPSPMATSRGLRSLPPPAPYRGAPTGPVEPRWVREARREIREAAAAFAYATERLRDMVLEVWSWR